MRFRELVLRLKEQSASARHRAAWHVVPVLAVSLFCCGALRAQGQRATPLPGSELGRENLSRVAASAGEIKAVLLNDPGLMVELKRWVAKDATDHGQIISDSDLMDDSIFERLEQDIQFRSVATLLVQRYGYLVPKLNPNSDFARQRELLIQERTKWLAQDTEEQLTQARQRASRGLQNTGSCDPQLDAGCNAAQTRGSPGAATGGQEPQQGTPPSFENAPGEQTPPALPRGGDSLERAQLMRTGEGLAGSFPQLPLEGSNGSIASVDNLDFGLNGNTSGTLQPQGTADGMTANDTSGQLSATLFGGVSGDQPQGSEGSTYGTGSAGSVGSTPGTSRTDGRAGNPSASLGTAGVTPVQPLNRQYQQRPTIEPAELIRKPNPYRDIPSLYDMYVQAVTRPTAPKRFGAAVFENGTRDSQLIPMDLPVGPDYVVGPGDGLAINLWGGVSERLYRTVDREGRISLPEVGPVLVSGKSLADVQENMQQILRTQFRGVSADVSLARLRTIRVYEVGDVANPGAYDISSLSTPLNALFAAGGPTTRGSLRIVKHYRGNQLVQTVDTYDLLLHGVKGDIQRLENGDTVLVPPIGPQVTVEGMVRRPAIYEVKDEKTLASVLELAGGLLPMATLRHIEVQRIVAHDKQTMLSLDVAEGDSDSEATKKLESFEIHDGDRIRVYPIAPYNQDAVYLEGHVIRPGRYSYKSGMRVTDVVGSYKDLLPEPAQQYAEIIRLNAPDFHPSVESFDLSDALANPSQAPVLYPMDTVRVFSRFDFENPPMVSVGGDVRAPGNYRTSGQVRLSDAVHLAGGIASDAETDDVQVFRYLPDGKLKIFSVSLNQALAGDPAQNILLQPRDRLLIHRSPDAVEPATVYIEGEVAKPGRYPLTTNMSVADLIRVGGGLQPSADTQAADLTRYQWLDHAKLNGQQETIPVSAALGGDPGANPPLHNGDVLTIRQLPGWNDLGASISVKGEVKHAGTYGIRPGERLSSILERAGGFQQGAYPFGAVLQRAQVRDLESKAQTEMIVRVKEAQTSLELLPETDARQKQAKEMALQQWQSSLDQLSANPPSGRVAIRISSDIRRWKNTTSDIVVRAGDTIIVPKRPGFVMVTGQVFNPTAIAYRPGKSAKWYLGQSGGPTQMANKKAIFVIRADGSVIGAKENLWSGSSLGAALQPGDTVVVPEKAITGGVQWQSVFLAAQVASSVASSVFIALRY